MTTDEIREVGVAAAAVALAAARGVRKPSITDRARAMTALNAGIAAIETAERLASEPCTAEIDSWDYFSPGISAVDRYWIRCTRVGPHDEHSDDGNTGAHWKDIS